MRKIHLSKILKEADFEYVRSSGPGGQNVNKRATKAQLRWNPDESQVLTENEKKKIKSRLNLTKRGDLILESDQARTQKRNKKIALQRFKHSLKKALKRKKERKKTKPPKKAKQKRLQEKKKRSEKKKLRKKINIQNY